MDGLQIEAFFHAPTNTIAYLIFDSGSRIAAIIDPPMDYEPKAARLTSTLADRMLARIKALDLKLDWVLETHAHADHVSAGDYLRKRTGAKIGIGALITKVQKTFKEIFHAVDLVPDGRAFDRLLDDGDRIALGRLSIEVMATPGHTPACVSYKIGNNLFVGDTLFMPDYGTARTDFPGGDARALYRSIQRILSLPHETLLWMAHDYLPKNRSIFAWKTTVGAQRRENVHIHEGVSEDAFVALRSARDKELAPPVLILPSIQMNIRAGALPPPESDGHVYLKLPVNRIGSAQ